MATKRQVSEQTVQLFQKYGKTMRQRMKKDEGVAMLVEEFQLTEQEAGVIFDFFDSDDNGELSTWEYQHFYDNVGVKARPLMDLFTRLESPETRGTVNMEKAYDTLIAMKRTDGSQPQGKEVEMMLKTYAGEEKTIDRAKFINLICSLRLELDPGANNHTDCQAKH